MAVLMDLLILKKKIMDTSVLIMALVLAALFVIPVILIVRSGKKKS
jgi:hypothetical protein